jgi:regulatory protein
VGSSELDEKILARARNTAYRLLTYRPRSRNELEKKLREKAFSENIITIVIDLCTRLGYVDDTQFALQWTLSRIRFRGFGRRRIGQELKNKGISREIIREVFAEGFSEETEIETAKRVARKKMNTMESLDHKTRRRRLAGFLERKGFSFEIIRTVLRDTE